MKKRTDKRLLSSLDHIDNKFTERAAERIKTRQVGMTGGVSKKRLIKQITLIAACFLMLVAAIPLVTTLVNKLPDYYAPSASNDSTSEAEIPPEATLPEEYFNKVYFATPYGVFEYEGQFVYYVNDSEDQYYGNIVKYDPETDRVSSICLDASCSHTPGECILAVPGIEYWDINYMEVFGDWLIYNYTDIGGVSVEFGTTVRLYNMKTGEAQIALETITTDNITKYCKGYLVMDDKVYLNIGEISEEQCSVSVNREYIVSYDPKTQETVYMCEEPEGLGFIGISNKRFFFNKGLDEVWSTDYKGENLLKEETLNFQPIAVSGIYAYEYRTQKNYIDVYDITTDSMFTIDFGGTIKSFCNLEDKLIYVKYKSEDKNGGTELWVCDLRGENRQLILESDEALFMPKNYISNYILGYTSKGGVTKNYILNISTGEIKEIQ